MFVVASALPSILAYLFPIAHHLVVTLLESDLALGELTHQTDVVHDKGKKSVFVLSLIHI